jgi:hypothetical protein
MDLELAVHKGLKGELVGALLSLSRERLIISTTTECPRSSVITHSLATG